MSLSGGPVKVPEALPGSPLPDPGYAAGRMWQGMNHRDLSYASDIPMEETIIALVMYRPGN